MTTEEVEFAGGAGVVRGSLSLPSDASDGTAEVPGVVLIGGSGPSDRHNDGFFDTIAAHLVGAGVAVLRYDKRGVGGSEGTWSTAGVDDLADDAAAAFAALCAHPGVEAESAGVFGHSEGGWVALRLCARGVPRLAVLNSCPAVSFLESEIYGLTRLGVGPDAAEDLLRRLIEAACGGASLREGSRILDACRVEPWYPLLSDTGFRLDEAAWEVLAAWGAYDPVGDLACSTTPTLAVFGRDDPVVPVDASALRLAETSKRTGREQQTVVFPDAGHRLHVAGELAPGYLERLAAWCRR